MTDMSTKRTKGGKRGRSMINAILICVFALGVTVFFIGAGIAIAWMVIQDSALGRAIDEYVQEWLDRRKRNETD